MAADKNESNAEMDRIFKDIRKLRFHEVEWRGQFNEGTWTLFIFVKFSKISRSAMFNLEVERAQFFRARAELELSKSSPDEPELFI